MEDNFEQVINQVDKELDQLKKKEISVGPLENAVSKLKKHKDNISKLEEHIDEIRSEIIEPVKGELKKAGRVSQSSLVIGILGFVLTAASLVFVVWDKYLREQLPPINTAEIAQELKVSVISEVKSVISEELKANLRPEIKIEAPPDVVTVLGEMKNDLDFLTLKASGLTGEYVPKQDELLVTGRKAILLETEEHKIYLNENGIGEEEIKGKLFPYVLLRFFVDNKQLGAPGLRDIVKITNNSGIADFRSHYLFLSEGDLFQIDTDKSANIFEIVRIYRERSQKLPVADEKNEVLIRLTNKIDTPG